MTNRFLPASSAQQRQLIPAQNPTPISVRLHFECSLTAALYRVYVIAGQPFYIRSDLPRDLQALTMLPGSEQRAILDGGRWLDLVPEATLYGAIRRAYPNSDHPFRTWHGIIVRETVERWRLDMEAA